LTVHRQRRRLWVTGLGELATTLGFIFGLLLLLLGFLVEEGAQIVSFYAYIIGYTGVLIFQVSIRPIVDLCIRC
jgi:hypothetical protein